MRKGLKYAVTAIVLGIAVVVLPLILASIYAGSLTFTFMQTESITVTNFDWGADNAYCLIDIVNTGSTDLSICEVRVNDEPAADDGIITPYTLAGGDAVTLNVTRVGGYVSGAEYRFEVITSAGSSFGPNVKAAP